MAGVVERIKLRFLPDEYIPEDAVIKEMAQTIRDRLLIRLKTDELPELGKSIVVDATMKALRLRGYEGSRSESSADGGSFSTSFIDDVLDAYKDDISALYVSVNKSGVAFL